MANKWWFKPQKEVNKRVESYDSSRFIDQTITKEVVFEKFIVVEDGKAKVLLFEYRKVEYGVGYVINKFEA